MSDVEQAIETLFRDTFTALRLPGLAVSVISNNELLLSLAHGVLDTTTQQPVTAHSLFRLGSITKVFTASLLMYFAQEELLDLNDPVADYLPELASIKWGGAITFQHLATHTSGLPFMPPTASFPDDLADISSVSFPKIESLLADLDQTILSFPPGTKYAYSNYGVALLGHALSSIAKRPYRDLIETHVLGPLSMDETCFDPAQNERLSLATGYITFVAPPAIMPPVNIAGFSPAGQLFSTVHDMVQFIRAQWEDPSPVLRNDTRTRMQTQVWQTDQGMAIGWKVLEIGESQCLYHGGADPGYVSYLIIEPSLRSGVIVMTNAGSQPERIEALGNDIMLNLIVSAQ